MIKQAYWIHLPKPKPVIILPWVMDDYTKDLIKKMGLGNG